MIRFGLPGERASRREAGDHGFLDGRKASPDRSGRNQAIQAGVLQSLLGRALRLYLPEGDHVFRAGFIGDDFLEEPDRERRLQRQEEQVSRIRSRSSDRLHPMWNGPAARRF